MRHYRNQRYLHQVDADHQFVFSQVPVGVGSVSVPGVPRPGHMFLVLTALITSLCVVCGFVLHPPVLAGVVVHMVGTYLALFVPQHGEADVRLFLLFSVCLIADFSCSGCVSR